MDRVVYLTYTHTPYHGTKLVYLPTKHVFNDFLGMDVFLSYSADLTETGRLFSTEQRPSLKLTAKAPKNGWLEYYFPIGEAYFQGLC